MIHPYTNQTQTLWERGVLQVQVVRSNDARPIGFCDGTPADTAELRAIAEAQGVEDPVVRKQVLDSGREVWTLGR